MPRPGRFTPGNNPVSLVYEVGWALRPVWTGAEILAPTGIRSPDRPATLCFHTQSSDIFKPAVILQVSMFFQLSL